MMGSFLFADKKGVHVHLCFLPLLRDLTHTATYSWGGAVLAHTYRELCRANLDRRHGISGCITLIQVCKKNYYIHIHIHNTSLGCLLSVYFIFSNGGRDFTWGDMILGYQQHIQHHQSLMPYMMTNVDVVDGDLVEALDDGLPIEPTVEPEPKPALPLGCRWRVPLTRVHNPSGVLLLYRDQLDAQTLDQVMIYVKVYGSIVISFIFT